MGTWGGLASDPQQVESTGWIIGTRVACLTRRKALNGSGGRASLGWASIGGNGNGIAREIIGSSKLMNSSASPTGGGWQPKDLNLAFVCSSGWAFIPSNRRIALGGMDELSSEDLADAQSRDWEELDLAEECIEISAFARRIQTCLTAYECGIPFVFFLKAIFAFIWFQPIDLYCAWISLLMIQPPPRAATARVNFPSELPHTTGIKEELCQKEK